MVISRTCTAEGKLWSSCTLDNSLKVFFLVCLSNLGRLQMLHLQATYANFSPGQIVLMLMLVLIRVLILVLVLILILDHPNSLFLAEWRVLE